MHSSETWTLTCVYGPCENPERNHFVTWLQNLQIQDNDNWLIIGVLLGTSTSFAQPKIVTCQEGTLMISSFLMVLLVILVWWSCHSKGRLFTWSNMQEIPLLEQLDWFFTSVNWTITYPNTVKSLTRNISYHVPCVISIQTMIPKAEVFVFKIIGQITLIS